MTDHYHDICCHGIPWGHCGCDDPGFDDDLFDDDDEPECPCFDCGELECDGTCTAGLLR